MMAAGLGWSRRQQESQSLRGHLTLMIIFLAGEHHRLSPSQAERGGGGWQILINILIINYNLQLTIIYYHQAGRPLSVLADWQLPALLAAAAAERAGRSGRSRHILAGVGCLAPSYRDWLPGPSSPHISLSASQLGVATPTVNPSTSYTHTKNNTTKQTLNISIYTKWEFYISVLREELNLRDPYLLYQN